MDFKNRKEDDAWRISPIRRSKPSRNQQQAAAKSLLETIGQEGHTRLKFVVRKQDLKQVLEAIRDGRGSSANRSASAASALAVSLEQRLNLMQLRQILRGGTRGRERSWKSWHPALHSIPEE
ncbi:hypothetical protein F511_17537 [Dorcoceras hygrometricum]|uniref:Uncharacterized protein n=1 Tax=Dorcoceras hygrometricum TaxID=472368 RepID=A0A2Z7C522_9LAMI|nr:hypothetical protein F511_17537 [Dorcoceras hygrometricum]